MELKLLYYIFSLRLVLLLIVPYGIETAPSVLYRYDVVYLLIVPYGIETLVKLCEYTNLLRF